jgi:hypothetical protein
LMNQNHHRNRQSLGLKQRCKFEVLTKNKKE